MKKLLAMLGLLLVFALTMGCTSTPEMSVKDLLLQDKTDQNEYIIDEYVCRDFALDVIENARKAGIEAYLFSVHWKGDTNDTHAIVAFIENGEIIFADVTQSDNWVKIDFKTGEYNAYDIRTEKLVMSSFIDWHYLDTER